MLHHGFETWINNSKNKMTLLVANERQLFEEHGDILNTVDNGKVCQNSIDADIQRQSFRRPFVEIQIVLDKR